jgi:hypothetical protein
LFQRRLVSKAAETDATKRTLSTFGNFFGRLFNPDKTETPDCRNETSSWKLVAFTHQVTGAQKSGKQGLPSPSIFNPGRPPFSSNGKATVDKSGLKRYL